MKAFTYRYAVLLLTGTLCTAHATEYLIQYKGVTLGDIDNLTQTINKLYLKAEVTNIIAKLLLRKKYFVFYENEKPDLSNAKFRRDKNNVLLALREAIERRPAHREYPSPGEKKLVLECSDNLCHYVFYKKKKIEGKGKIEFDGNNQFYRLTEIKNGVVIKRK
ncbi:MAG TPA: hypothetical protein ENK93_05855 [Campylobacteraceae bacterium]|jgi:hypothetical protein|nr:hypothetical protein [Campylobacteraceae bacterium]HHD84387.1 hypothetical protein [Campylobacteraceae bacterium]